MCCHDNYHWICINYFWTTWPSQLMKPRYILAESIRGRFVDLGELTFRWNDRNLCWIRLWLAAADISTTCVRVIIRLLNIKRQSLSKTELFATVLIGMITFNLLLFSSNVRHYQQQSYLCLHSSGWSYTAKGAMGTTGIDWFLMQKAY